VPLERSFTGLLMGTPVVLALAASALLSDRSRVVRNLLAVAVGLCYLQAAYLVQASLKEPIEATMLVAFAAGLHELQRDRPASRRRAVPVAVLAAGSIYAYSYPAALWIGGTLALGATQRHDGAVVERGRRGRDVRAAQLPVHEVVGSEEQGAPRADRRSQDRQLARMRVRSERSVAKYLQVRIGPGQHDHAESRRCERAPRSKPTGPTIEFEHLAPDEQRRQRGGDRKRLCGKAQQAAGDYPSLRAQVSSRRFAGLGLGFD
jgi:hypothetical protein